MTFSGPNYVLKKHEDFDQYGPFAIHSEIMPFYIYPASFVNQNENTTQLSYVNELTKD